jgi:hypothetical protein
MCTHTVHNTLLEVFRYQARSQGAGRIKRLGVGVPDSRGTFDF